MAAPGTSGEIVRRLERLSARWSHAEAKIKRVEFLSGEIVASANNELRYAGRQILNASIAALTDANQDETTRRLIIAERYVQNAETDITDAALAFVSLHVRKLIEKYGLVEIRKFAPDIDALLDSLDLAQSLVIASREQRDREREIYTQLEYELLPQILERHQILTRTSFEKSSVLVDAQRQAFLTLLGSAASLVTFIAAASLFATKLDLWQLFSTPSP